MLRADVDDFFDNIDHTILQQRLIAVGIDGEIVRYIMLCLEMGKMRQGSAKWNDSFLGVPQGAPLSPLLANLYLHSFDQFAVSRGAPYIRYADDFLYLCESEVIVQRGKDWVNIYPLCTECYARIQYIPDVLAKIPDKIIVI